MDPQNIRARLATIILFHLEKWKYDIDDIMSLGKSTEMIGYQKE
jgi:hypothetical protein